LASAGNTKTGCLRPACAAIRTNGSAAQTAKSFCDGAAQGAHAATRF
jgi:hypothetical protein